MDSSWEKNWQDLQKQYMEALSSVLPTASRPGPSQPNFFGAGVFPGAEMFNIPPAPASASSSSFTDFINSCNYWGNFAGQFQSLMQGMAAAGQAGENWESMLQQQIEQMKANLSGSGSTTAANPLFDAMQNSMEFWQKSFEALGPQSKGRKASKNSGNFDSVLEDFLSSLPAAGQVGASKDIQLWFDLWQDYQARFKEYQEMLQSVDVQSLDVLQQRISELAHKGESISGAGDVFRLWVDSHEEIWSKHMQSEEFSKLYGALVNAVLLLKKHFEEFSTAMASMNPGEDQEKAGLLSELETLKAQTEEDRKKIATLEQRLDSVIEKQSSTATRKTTRKKKTGKKASRKTTKKKQ